MFVCLLAVYRMTVFPSGKLKFCAPRAGHNSSKLSLLRFMPVLQTTYYKLEALDRRERMGSVRKRRKAGRATGKEATTNLKLQCRQQ